MRIALMAHTNAPWTPHYARHFLSAGHEVQVLSFSPDPIDGVDVIHVGHQDPSGPLKPFWLASRLPRARRALRRFRPDAVLAPYMSSNGMTAALIFRGPLVVSARGGDVLRQAGYLPAGPRLHRLLMKFVCGRASIVHAVSDELADALVASGVPRDRIVCFPLGVDVLSFAPLPGARGGGGPPRIICTRRQEPVYANEIVVEGLKWLKDRGRDFRCTMAGGGLLMQERLAQIGRLGLADVVTCAGQVPPEAIRSLLAASDVYVSASTSDGTSSSLLEAMATGAFPVVSRIRANEAWLRNEESCLFFEAGDAAGLGRALERALHDDPLRVRAAQSNRALVVRDGNQRLNMERMLDLLQRAAGGSADQLRMPFQTSL
jgi:glycosyltransferase involved in cell wall biosynthesis